MVSHRRKKQSTGKSHYDGHTAAQGYGKGKTKCKNCSHGYITVISGGRRQKVTCAFCLGTTWIRQ